MGFYAAKEQAASWLRRSRLIIGRRNADTIEKFYER